MASLIHQYDETISCRTLGQMFLKGRVLPSDVFYTTLTLVGCNVTAEPAVS